MGTEVRVVSYNIRTLRDDRAALAAVVRELAPDVLLVQEAPRRFRWRHKCAALAHSLDLVVAAGGLPGLGNLVLTDLRVQVERTWCLRFPLTPGRHLRGAAFVQCRVRDTPFVVVASHLATDPVERPEQARLLRRALADLPAAVVLGADVNDTPGGAAWRAVADGLVDAATTAAAGGGGDRPTYWRSNRPRRIDGIFVDPRITVESYRVLDTPESRRASDHLPVVADLSLPA